MYDERMKDYTIKYAKEKILESGYTVNAFIIEAVTEKLARIGGDASSD